MVVQNNELVRPENIGMEKHGYEPSGWGSEPNSDDEMMLGGTDCDPSRLSLSEKDRGVDEPDALEDPEE